MRPHLELTLTGARFSLTPLPMHIQSCCTCLSGCRRMASHRLLSRRTASVQLLCDEHTLEWARENGYGVTMGDNDIIVTEDAGR